MSFSRRLKRSRPARDSVDSVMKTLGRSGFTAAGPPQWAPQSSSDCGEPAVESSLPKLLGLWRTRCGGPSITNSLWRTRCGELARKLGHARIKKFENHDFIPKNSRMYPQNRKLACVSPVPDIISQENSETTLSIGSYALFSEISESSLKANPPLISEVRLYCF